MTHIKNIIWPITVDSSIHVFQTTYNGYGQSLKPLVVHDGCISDNLQQHYDEKLSFMQTNSGDVDYNALGGCIDNVYEYVLSNSSIEKDKMPTELYFPNDH